MINYITREVFLICSERSGSNLITRIIDAHPDYCGPAPLHMIRTFSRNLFRYGDLKLDTNWKILVHDIVNLINAQLGIWATSWNEQKIIERVTKRDFASIVRLIYEEEARANGKRHIMIKENRIHTFLPFILINFPRAKFLYLVRDPRDMALSWKLSPNHPGEIHSGAEVWKEDQEKGIETVGFLSGTGRIHIIKYETLVSDGALEVKGLCDFLGCSYHPSMLEYYRNDLTVKNATRLKNWSNLKKPLMSNNFNKYKTKLSGTEIKHIESICKNEMKVFDYKLEFPDLNVSPAEYEIVEKNNANNIYREQKLDNREKEIRERRLDIINCILNRALY